MQISRVALKTVLEKLQDSYPFFLTIDGYKELAAELGSEVSLDAHLLYLQEKRLILTDLSYDSTENIWKISPNLTRITASGIDFLEDL